MENPWINIVIEKYDLLSWSWEIRRREAFILQWEKSVFKTLKKRELRDVMREFAIRSIEKVNKKWKKNLTDLKDLWVIPTKECKSNKLWLEEKFNFYSQWQEPIL